MVPPRPSMPSLTLRHIPEKLHARLKDSASRNRRSLNSEILARLERDFVAPMPEPAALARDLAAFTSRLPRVDHGKVARYKRS